MKIAEKYTPDRMYTMWACVSPRGYYLAAFRTKRAAQHERQHYRPESTIEKINVSPWERVEREAKLKWRIEKLDAACIEWIETCEKLKAGLAASKKREAALRAEVQLLST